MEHVLAIQLFEVVAWGQTISFAVAGVETASLGRSHSMLTEAVPLSR